MCLAFQCNVVPAGDCVTIGIATCLDPSRRRARQVPVGAKQKIEMLYDQPREIVGLVGDVRQNRYEYAPEPQMYVPRAQLPRKMDMALSFDVEIATFIVRAKGDPATLVPSSRGRSPR